MLKQSVNHDQTPFPNFLLIVFQKYVHILMVHILSSILSTYSKPLSSISIVEKIRKLSYSLSTCLLTCKLSRCCHDNNAYARRVTAVAISLFALMACGSCENSSIYTPTYKPDSSGAHTVCTNLHAHMHVKCTYVETIKTSFNRSAVLYFPL